MTRECGAKARTNNHKPCRQPAMTNGRCRLHGGLSTGPKTSEGKEKSRQAVLKHGFYTKASIEERRYFHSTLNNHRECLHNIEKLNLDKPKSNTKART